MTELEIASKALEHLFNIQNPILKKMNGYGSLNYRVDSKGEKFVLKIYPTSEDVHLLHAENQLFNFLNKKFTDYPNLFPKVFPTTDGKFISTYQTTNQTFYIRLLSFLEGSFFAEVPHSNSLLESFGSFLGKMDKALLEFRHPAIDLSLIHI